MHRLPIVLAFGFLMLFATGGTCGSSGGSDAQEACRDACETYDACGINDPAGDCNNDCEDEADRESGNCEDAAVDYFNCLEAASCMELNMGFGACSADLTDFGNACGF